MDKFRMPFGAEFSPDKIRIADVLKMADDIKNSESKKLVDLLNEKCFHNKTMAGNCKTSMVAYHILQPGKKVEFTEFGNSLLALEDEDAIYSAMAKHILVDLNGMLFISAIDGLHKGGMSPTLERVAEELSLMGCENVAKTNKHVPTMKKWLEKAGVLEGWDVQENKIKELLRYDYNDIEAFKELKDTHIYFLRTLCNMGTEEYVNSVDVRKLAKVSYGANFPEKSFSAQVLNPLVEKGFIEKELSASTHGGNAPRIKITGKTKSDILIPLLGQIEIIVGKEVILYLKKSFVELRKEIDSKNTHIKGMALEAFAIKVMNIVGLDFAGTRVKGSQTSGAEVDALFDTTRLSYSRWQVQCKNKDKVDIEDVAKEVGLTHVLKSNVIVIMTTGKATKAAKKYSEDIMRDLNICIIFIEGGDIEKILGKPVYILEVLDREANKAKKQKILEHKGNWRNA